MLTLEHWSLVLKHLLAGRCDIAVRYLSWLGQRVWREIRDLCAHLLASPGGRAALLSSDPGNDGNVCCLVFGCVEWKKDDKI